MPLAHQVTPSPEGKRKAMDRRGFLVALGTLGPRQTWPLQGSAEAGMAVTWNGWHPELVADLAGIDALWIEAYRDVPSHDARGLIVSFLRDAGETQLTIHRVQLPWAAVSGGLYTRGPVSFRARMAVTLDGAPHTATHLIFQRRASVSLYRATMRVEGHWSLTLS
jgi:hypothetical protein